MSDDAPLDLTDGGPTTGPGGTTGGPGEVPASTGGVVDLDRLLGNIPVVFVFLGDPRHPTGQEVLRSLGERLVDFGHDRVQVLAVSPLDQQDLQDVGSSVTGNARVLSDPDGGLASRFDGAYHTGSVVTVLVDDAGRVVERWVDQPDGTIGDAVLERLGGLNAV